MKKTKIILIKGRKKLSVEGYRCNFLEQGKGLMFSGEKNAKILLFKFKKPSHLSIHSLFVFFPFIAVWTDGKNHILEWKRIKPFTFHVSSPASGFNNLVEIPMTKKHLKVVKFFK